MHCNFCETCANYLRKIDCQLILAPKSQWKLVDKKVFSCSVRVEMSSQIQAFSQDEFWKLVTISLSRGQSSWLLQLAEEQKQHSFAIFRMIRQQVFSANDINSSTSKESCYPFQQANSEMSTDEIYIFLIFTSSLLSFHTFLHIFIFLLLN